MERECVDRGRLPLSATKTWERAPGGRPTAAKQIIISFRTRHSSLQSGKQRRDARAAPVVSTNENARTAGAPPDGAEWKLHQTGVARSFL